MTTSIKALARPALLEWARRTANYEPVAAARKIGVPDGTVERWESGEVAPTIAELRRAATVFKRPLAVFFLPEPPGGFETLRDFRLLADGVTPAWSAALHAEYRRAHQQREALLEIFELDMVEPSRDWRLHALPQDNDGIAARAREALRAAAPMPAPRASSTEYEHLNYWTSAVEATGVMVMSTERGGVHVEEMRAFSLYFDDVPVIALNGADWVRGRLFSLLHEFAHLQLNTSGVCDTRTDRVAATPDRRLEARCNAIAASLLMPAGHVLSTDAVVEHPAGEPWTLPQLLDAARPFGVSVEAFLRRLVTLGEVPLETYRDFRAASAANPAEPRKATGGDFYVTKSRDLGRGYVRTVTDAHQRALIDTYSAAAFLDVKVSQIARLARAAGL